MTIAAVLRAWHSQLGGKLLNTIRQWKQTPIILAIFIASLVSLAGVGSGAEVTSVLASYGGTAGYQLPLWINKEAGLYPVR